jgi:hypothetical protein
MFERFRKSHADDAPQGADDGRGSVALGERERQVDGAALHDEERDARFRRDEATTAVRPPAEPVRPPAERHTARRALAAEDLHELRARQRDRFGGFSWGSDFFGWLCAVGLASILTTLLVAAGTSIGLSEVSDAATGDEVREIGLTGGILLLAVLAVAWFCGGYVAGRMARFDGTRQGVGVWLLTILAALAVALLAAIGGREYDLFEQLNLPRIPVNGQSLTTGGAIALGAALVTTLIAAVMGGKVGERFHRKVDRTALTD